MTIDIPNAFVPTNSANDDESRVITKIKGQSTDLLIQMYSET
jgi:hypothetical protein